MIAKCICKVYIFFSRKAFQFHSQIFNLKECLLNVAGFECSLMTKPRDVEMDGEGEVFIGPPPPAVIKEAESANEAERFEEVHYYLFYT